MKSNVLLTSMTVLLATAAGANALEYKPFVGVNMGLQGVVYSDEAKDMERISNIDFPADFFAFGIDAGVRAGSYNRIYNGGVTLSATKSTYSKIQHKYLENRVADADLFNIATTYDNFIRISGDKDSRIDLVLGAGVGMMAYHIDPVDGDSDTRWSFATEFKVGMDFELTKHFTLSANARTMVPLRDNYAADMSYIIGGGVKYMF